jgi:FKBP-type peptidyl-prolyl cis-trans isomerase
MKGVVFMKKIRVVLGLALCLVFAFTFVACGSSSEEIAQDDAPSTAESLSFYDEKVGDGKEAKEGDKVKVDYTGKYEDGTVFDSSEGEGRDPFEFTIGNGEVIQGWDQGVPGMRVGGTRVLTVPPSLGYQDGKVMIFTIKLLKVS